MCHSPLLIDNSFFTEQQFWRLGFCSGGFSSNMHCNFSRHPLSDRARSFRMEGQAHKPHRKSKEKKGHSGGSFSFLLRMQHPVGNLTLSHLGPNPKAFAVHRPGKLQKQAARSQDVCYFFLGSDTEPTIIANASASPFRSRKSAFMYPSSTDYPMNLRRGSSPSSALPAWARRPCSRA